MFSEKSTRNISIYYCIQSAVSRKYENFNKWFYLHTVLTYSRYFMIFNCSKSSEEKVAHEHWQSPVQVILKFPCWSEKIGMWCNHMPQISLHWFSEPGLSEGALQSVNGWHSPLTSQASPLITDQQDLHHLVWCGLVWSGVVAACWNSHSRTVPWLAFQSRYAQAGLTIQWMVSAVFSFHNNIHTITTTHHHISWEQLLFILF